MKPPRAIALLAGCLKARMMTATKRIVATSARVAALRHDGGLGSAAMRALRESCLRWAFRASGLGGRVVRPRTSTTPAALPRCLVRRLRFVWAISPLQGSSVASGGEDEAALVQHARAVDLERRLGDDTVEVDRHR